LTEATAGQCQVGSRTDRPCVRPAVVKILGVPFCEQCAREQETYFAIGELTLARGPVSDWPEGVGNPQDRSLFEALRRMRRGFVSRVEYGGEALQAAGREALR
jgi:hypothetical protein